MYGMEVDWVFWYGWVGVILEIGLGLINFECFFKSDVGEFSSDCMDFFC